MPQERDLSPHTDAARVAGVPITAPRPSFGAEESGWWGGGAINHQFKRAQTPLGDAQGNITQLLEQNFYLLFFSTLAGQQHSFSGRGTCTSSFSSRTDEDMSLTTDQTQQSSYSALLYKQLTSQRIFHCASLDCIIM